MNDMNKHLKNIWFLIPLFSCVLLSAQVRISSEDELELVKQTPLEAIYTHTSGTLFMPGEYLYYSVYCINTQTYRLSALSEVAYVRLVSEDNVVVFTQKIDLKDGRGQGDYFFPTELPSGNYKLVVYTHWMNNAGISQFFKADITFVNPYRSDQGVFLNPETPNPGCPDPENKEAKPEVQAPSRDLVLELDKPTYKKGEAVQLQVKNSRGARGYGSYSLSVRRMDSLPGPKPISAQDYGATYSELLKKIPQGVNDILAIPEQRGQLISGQVTTSTGAALSDRSLALSLPGENFQVKKVRTDEEGKFYTYLTRAYNARTGLAEVLNSGPEVTDIRFNWYDPHDFEGKISCFNHFVLKPDMEEEIRKRSIHNQIENSYFEVKPDTLQQFEASDPFEGDIPQVYELDDYTRFPSLEETLVEYIGYVWIKREDNGEKTFYVREPSSRQGTYYTTDPPLVVVDGILVPNHQSLLDYDARKIKTIKVLRNAYQLGGQNYQGMVAIETIDKTFLENWNSEVGSRFIFLPPSPRKNYFRQTSAGPDNIPDFRYQLLWEPNIALNGAGESFTFFTSSIPGTYQVQLEGFTSFGKPISVRSAFVVE